MNTWNVLLVLNAGGIIAAIGGLLVGVIGIVYCIWKAVSNDTPPNLKPWWFSGILAGGLFVVLGILTLAGVI